MENIKKNEPAETVVAETAAEKPAAAEEKKELTK